MYNIYKQLFSLALQDRLISAKEMRVMIPLFKHKHFAMALKLTPLVFFIILGSVMLYNGKFFIAGAVLFTLISFLGYKVLRHRQQNKSKYDDIGYWSGLDDFELGIDLHCFDDLDLDEQNDFDVLSGDYFNRKPLN